MRQLFAPLECIALKQPDLTEPSKFSSTDYTMNRSSDINHNISNQYMISSALICTISKKKVKQWGTISYLINQTSPRSSRGASICRAGLFPGRTLLVSKDMRADPATAHATLLSVFLSWPSSPFLGIPYTLLLLLQGLDQHHMKAGKRWDFLWQKWEIGTARETHHP